MDDNTPNTDADINDLIKYLEGASAALFLRFDDSLVKINPDKCHLLMSSNENITVKIGECGTVINECEKLLAVKLD